MSWTYSRRRFRRVGALAQVILYTAEQPRGRFDGRILNCSRQGLYLETDAELEKGRFVSLSVERVYSDTLNLPRKRELLGRIAWSRTLNDPFSYLYGYGVDLEY
jgi:hypothetical protein